MTKKEMKKADEAALPAFIEDDLPDQAGFEGADADSFAIPFLQIVQKGSPQCDETSAEYDPDIRAGMIRNSVTGETWDGKEGVLFVPCAFQRRFLKWGGRKAGGGFMGEFMPEEVDALVAAGKIAKIDGGLYEPKPDGTVDVDFCPRYKDTRNHFGLLLEGDHPAQVLLSLSSTQIKKSKALMSLLRQQFSKSGKVLPTYASKIRITTVPESNDQGSWYGVKFTHEGFVDDAAVYEAGKEFWETIAAGEAKVQYAEAADEPTTPSDTF